MRIFNFISLFSVLIIFLYSCNSKKEDKQLERMNEIAELNGIESQIKWLVENASPERDTVGDKLYLNKLFEQVLIINSKSEDSILDSRSKKIIESKELAFKTYFDKANDIIGSGTITSIADGINVVNVNIWNSVSANREIVGSLKNGDNVIVLMQNGEYYLVFSRSKNIRGYVLKGYVINLKYH